MIFALVRSTEVWHRKVAFANLSCGQMDERNEWEEADAIAEREYNLAPRIDEKSPHGHLIIGRGYLRSITGGERNEILRANLIGVAPNQRMYWFRDCKAVRKELGMK